MLRVRQAIVVEGRYDRIRLASVVDAMLIETGGFRVFRDKEKRAAIRALAHSCGIIVLTDSDDAGFRIRRYLKGVIGPGGDLTNVYIPQIEGVERRKGAPSREGLLGVEGMDEKTLREAFQKAGVGCDEGPRRHEITKTCLYDLGLIGAKESREKRELLLRSLGLPGYLSTASMIEMLNVMMPLDEFRARLRRVGLED